jgi:molybdenum cofactor synthesis domain-containing protein
VVKRYLNLVSLADARRILARTFSLQIPPVQVPLEEAIGGVTALPLYARFSVPEYPVAAMDGIAVRSSDTIGASEQRPLMLSLAVRVNTGNPLPRETDAVIMIEEVWEEQGTYTIQRPVAPWQHVRAAGEDIGEGEMILPAFHQIRPHEAAALAAYGITEVPLRVVSIGLIPTGSELIPAGERPGSGQAVESNTLLARGLLERVGVRCTRYPIVPDQPKEIRSALVQALAAHDMVILSAGSSAGTRDFTAEILQDLGEVLVHGVAIKPGKPVILARVGEQPVIGLPGYPLSALTVLRELVLPFLRDRGFPIPQDPEQEVLLSSTLHSEIGTDEFVFLSVGKVRDRWVGVPLSRGAGVQMSAVRANAYFCIPSSREGYEAGEPVQTRLLVPATVAEHALLITGSHDPSLDELRDLLQQQGIDLHSSHVGSMGGILALKRGDCHAAPMHLLGPKGEYNTPYLERYLPGMQLCLLCIAEREQGIVSRERLELSDLPGRRFVNRQKGSGTRMLFDHLLRTHNLDPATIPGYDREVTTHQAVALAVKTGEAEAGICVYSAAHAYGLPFVPLATERYELVMRTEDCTDERLKRLIACVRSDEYRNALQALGGYDLRETGQIRSFP